MSRTLVVTRKKDKAQIRVIKQFEDKGLILWDVLPQNGRKALSIDALELTSAKLFWVRHAMERTMPCGHVQPSDAHDCYKCVYERVKDKRRPPLPKCVDGRKLHQWSAFKVDSKRCVHCKVRAVFDTKTMNVVRYER